MSEEYKDLVNQFALVSFLFPVLLGSILIWFIISYQRKKFQNETEKKDALLREQTLIIEKQQAIERERTRIASEMHDDLGSGLTTIRYLSDKALMQAKDTEEAAQIQRIADHSNTLVRNMSEIIWAMNSRYDDAENLMGYLRRYASEFLDEHGISLKFDPTDRQWDEVIVGGEVRRNLFLVFKEILHNTVKYSGATQVIVEMEADDQLTIRITETGGKGFDPDAAEGKGNGLYNCRKRMDFIHGQIAFEKTPEAMQFILSAPINATS
jgi:signal transduction histidine kinase